MLFLQNNYFLIGTTKCTMYSVFVVSSYNKEKSILGNNALDHSGPDRSCSNYLYFARWMLILQELAMFWKNVLQEDVSPCKIVPEYRNILHNNHSKSTADISVTHNANIFPCKRSTRPVSLLGLVTRQILLALIDEMIKKKHLAFIR